MAIVSTSILVNHASGSYAEYAQLTDDQKRSFIYYCTDTSGKFQGCVIYDSMIYGQGNGGVTNIVTSQDANGAYVTFTFRDGTTTTVTLSTATSSAYGVVKTKSSLPLSEAERLNQGLVPTMAVVEAIDNNKAPKISPVFTGTPKAPNTQKSGTSQIVTIDDLNSVIDGVANSGYQGTLGTGGTITALPAISGDSVKQGHAYKVVTAGTYANQPAKVGDMFVANKTAGKWDLIPSGDEKETSVRTSGTVSEVNVSGTAQNGNVVLGTAAAKVAAVSGATVNDDDNSVPTEKRVNEKIASLRNSDVITKVESIESDTLDVNVTSEQGGKQVDIELKELHTAEGVFGGVAGPQNPAFGGTVNVYPVKVDKYGRATGNGTPATVKIPNNVASTSAAGLMSANDKKNLDAVVAASTWIRVTGD